MSGRREPYRILELISGLGVGGAERTLRNVAVGLRDRGWGIEVVSLSTSGPTGDALRQEGIAVESLEMTRGRPSAVALGTLIRQLTERPPDILQSWMYHADLLGTMAAGCVPGMRLAWNIRASDMDWSAYRRMSRWTLSACMALSGRPDVVIANSHTGVDHHASLGYRPKRWCVIPNGIDISCFRPDEVARAEVRRELGLTSATPVVGLLARLDPMKDHETFFGAAAILARRHSEVVFLLAGEGTDSGNVVMRELAQRYGVAGRTRLLGVRSDVPRLLSALDVLVLTSRFGEGFPNVVAEAMACAVPCVVTDTGDAAAIVGEDGGKVVQIGAPGEVADGCSRLLNLDTETRRHLGARARKRIVEVFDLERCLDRYEAIYREILETP